MSRPRVKVAAGKLTKEILAPDRVRGQAPGEDSAFTETPGEMVRRVCRELGNKQNLVVINDEAHHCYRRKPDGEDEALSGEERREVEKRAEEAVRGVGFDLLLVCGFAFDPHVAEEATRYGKLAVLTARMNPDLAMGDTLLKKTGSGNLFMVFGEPDIVTRRQDGQVVVEIRGLDIYDPTTGEIRSSSTEDIACWFVDTDYNEETFFVRHAYFTGGDRPYDKLQKALRAEIDEDAWSALYSTVSRPFDPPATGKIAVKVINHYGDEVLKVYEVANDK